VHSALPVEHVVYQRLLVVKRCWRRTSHRCLYGPDRFRAGKFMSAPDFSHVHVTSASDHVIQKRVHSCSSSTERVYQDPTEIETCRQLVGFTHVLLEILTDQAHHSCEAGVFTATTGRQTRRRYYRLFRRGGKRHVCYFHSNSSTNDWLDISNQ